MICKLKGQTKDYLWGGTKLVQGWNKTAQTDIVAESWEVSTHADGTSIVVDCDNASFIGKKLTEIEPNLPVLIKLIDANSDLSVQVHPDDNYAKQFESDSGKTEMWYIADCEKGAKLYIGFKQNLTRIQLLDHIHSNTLQEVLQSHEVAVGQSYFIPAGTVHAIGCGIVILEIQQSSNLTYRMYDYGRRDKAGNQRLLHLEKAAEVAHLKPFSNQEQKLLDNGRKLLSSSNFFTVYECCGCGTIEKYPHSFSAVTILEGTGKIGGMPYQKGDSFFITANSDDVSIDGNAKYILTRI